MADNHRIKDDTVPYPSSGIDTVDHFAEWDRRGTDVEADEDGIMINCQRGKSQRVDGGKRGWARSLGTLPPVLRYRYPYNYVSCAFPLAQMRVWTRQADMMADHTALFAHHAPAHHAPHVRPIDIRVISSANGTVSHALYSTLDARELIRKLSIRDDQLTFPVSVACKSLHKQASPVPIPDLDRVHRSLLPLASLSSRCDRRSGGSRGRSSRK